jgi:DNA-directed RNA polymerase specialized sigma24 family protein
VKQNTVCIVRDTADELSFAERTQKEQVLRGEQVLRAARLLETEEFALLKMHDIEGRSVGQIREHTGLSVEDIEARVETLRNRFADHVQIEARRWSKQVAVVEGAEE